MSKRPIIDINWFALTVIVFIVCLTIEAVVRINNGR